MPAVDPQKLKRLMILELLAPFAMKRGLCNAQLGDLVFRAMQDKRFDLSASSDTFVNFLLDEAEATNWAEELERSRKAPHLFTMDAVDAVKPEETFGGYTAAELDRMSPQDRLVIANRVEYQRAKNQ